MTLLFRWCHSLLIGLFALLVPLMPLLAEERILSYDVEIVVHRDATLRIKEDITVRAENNQIKRGIYRDFPTDYRDRSGNRVKVQFSVEEVLRDGAPEAYHTKSHANGVRTYVGNKDRYVSPGIHEYSLSYRTNRQLGFFENADELYYNAIPHGFIFPIDSATVTVYLPEEVPKEQLRVTAYTGRQGSKEQNFRSSARANSVTFQLTRPLASYQGMTVVVEFPKGIVTEPDEFTKWSWFFSDNLHWLILLLGVAGTLGYYVWVWNKVGRDPRPGAIIPRWEPPEDYSAPDMVYVIKKGASPAVIAACVVEAAVKGWIEIDDSGSDTILKKTLGEAPLSEEAKAFYYELFAAETSVELDKSNHRLIRSAMDRVYELLDKEHRRQSFILNRGYWFMGMVCSLLTLFLFIAFSILQNGEPQVLSTVILIFYTGIINVLFARWLKAPTRSGRRDLDRIEGFKMYLDSAERDTFRELGAPHDSLEVFEKFLPYAVALGVDYNWGKRFQSIIEQAIAEDKIDFHRASVYQSSYSSSMFSSSSLSSALSSSIASSSTPPGSSSGGGGGGSSGGGGGGGGGGGW